MNKIDPVEIESYERKQAVKVVFNILTVFVIIGTIVVILSPYIIDYFTK